MESSHGVHEDQPGLQTLLCRAYGETAQGNGRQKLRERVQAHSSAADARTAAAVAHASYCVREFDVRLVFTRTFRDDFILKVFDVMRRASWHTFQVLTKRSDRLLQMDEKIDWPENVWMGVSVENADYQFRIDHLRRTRAKTKFLSLEPPAGSIAEVGLKKNRLGDCRRRVGPRGKTDAAGLVERNPRPVRRRQGGLFLQTMGRNKQKTDGS